MVGPPTLQQRGPDADGNLAGPRAAPPWPDRVRSVPFERAPTYTVRTPGGDDRTEAEGLADNECHRSGSLR